MPDVLRRRRFGLSCVLALTCAFLPSPAGAQSDRSESLPADDANVRQLRRQLENMEQRRMNARGEIVFGWELNPRPLEVSTEVLNDESRAVVELHYSAREIPCFVRFEPVDSAGTSPVFAPMFLRGSQWIELPKGDWRVELLAGYVTGPVVPLPEATVNVEGGKVYRLTFGLDQEILARDLAREQSERIRKAGRLPGVSVSPSP